MRVRIPESMRKLYTNPDRMELVKRFTGGAEPTLTDLNVTHRFLKALAETVGSRRRTVLRGLGTFEWTRWKGKTPGGDTVKSWRLAFQLTRSARRYKGGK